MTTTNADRAARAMDALEAHRGGSREPITRSSLVDLLTDLRHWADVYQVSFKDALEWSEVHWTDEVREERRAREREE